LGILPFLKNILLTISCPLGKLTPMKFGEKVRELRENKDMSLRELAHKIDCSAAFLSDVELGRRHLSDEKFEKLARALGVTVEELRRYDTRAPIKDLKTLAESNPAYGVALRKLADKKVSPEALIEFLNKEAEQKKKP
jgi:transcriptional regulator with XRE-family HTH domain